MLISQFKHIAYSLFAILIVALISISLFTALYAQGSSIHFLRETSRTNPATNKSTSPINLVPLTDIAQVSAGDSHACALTTQGGVKCWGYNHSGRLGDGTTVPRLTATDVDGLASGITAISAGGDHTCALTLQGGIKCWGNNEFGQLGDSTTVSRLIPVDVMGLSSGVIAISAGGSHTCALTSQGGIKCWGKNSYSGQLGDGTTINRLTPIDVSGLTSGITAIGAGSAHTCAVTQQGGVKCWGDGEFGRLGNASDQIQPIPVDVSGLTSGIVTIATNYRHTCALTTTGGIKCWGSNSAGQLGDGTDDDHYSPVDVMNLSQSIQSITVGRSHTCALTTQNSVECWGSNYVGQLGDGTSVNHYTPHVVPALSSSVATLSAANNHTCALISQGSIKCWGSNVNGELGNGTSANQVEPIKVAMLSSGVNAISTSFLHTCAITTDGGTKCWGRNVDGQLGDGTTTGRLTPVDVTGLTSGIVGIAAGYEYTCALTTLGGVKCWGRSGSGQLGDGSGNDHLTAVDVAGLTSGVTAITSGGYHACALRTEGNIKCWGDNKAGQLGDETNSDRLMPVSVVGLTTDITAISAGLAHTCAINMHGDVKCWGDNRVGQLGHGSAVASNIPIDVTGLTSDTVELASGSFHTCALSGENSVRCWGNNSHGQLGDGTTTIHPTPTDVLGLNSDVIAITAGYEHTCALTVQGSVKCWGNNNYGQLGDGTTTSHQVPVDTVGLDNDVIAVTAGFSHTCALTILGSVKCWGANHYSQLGDGSDLFYAIPGDVLVKDNAIAPTPTPTAPPINTPTATEEPTMLPTSTSTPTKTLSPTATILPIATPTPTNTSTNVPVFTTTIGPEGGTVSGQLSQETVLIFPPGAVAELVHITMSIDEDAPPLGEFQVLGRPFRIEAHTTTGTPVTQFRQIFTITIHFTTTDVQEIRPEDMTIYYYAVDYAEWVSIPSNVDLTTQTVTARLDHLTQFAVLVSEQQQLFLPFVTR